MQIESILMALIIGAIAGWLAGKLFKGRGFGLMGNIVVGIIGAVVGSFLFGELGITAGSVVLRLRPGRFFRITASQEFPNLLFQAVAGLQGPAVLLQHAMNFGRIGIQQSPAIIWNDTTVVCTFGKTAG